MDPWILVYLLLILGLVLQGVTLTVLWPRGGVTLTAPAPEAEPDEGEIEPTDLAVLRHAHRFGGKDADGIRHCRCGDRYLDGMRI